MFFDGGYMSTNGEKPWKLKFDCELWDVVLPPESMKVVRRTIKLGPNLQQIEHCRYADTMPEMWRRAPVFHMRVPICDKGKPREWNREVGQHLSIQLPIALLQDRRINDHVLNLIGNVKFATDFDLNFANQFIDKDTRVNIKGYSVHTREAEIFMSNNLYFKIVTCWRHNGFETS